MHNFYKMQYFAFVVINVKLCRLYKLTQNAHFFVKIFIKHPNMVKLLFFMADLKNRILLTKNKTENGTSLTVNKNSK